MELLEKCIVMGLLLRVEVNGKIVVVGLLEWVCEDLCDFEKMYIEVNNNCVIVVMKFNVYSSCSYVVLCVKFI